VLCNAVGKENIGKNLGGNLPVEDVEGKVLADLLEIYSEKFESKL
jgi:hypothetical protein